MLRTAVWYLGIPVRLFLYCFGWVIMALLGAEENDFTHLRQAFLKIRRR